MRAIAALNNNKATTPTTAVPSLAVRARPPWAEKDREKNHRASMATSKENAAPSSTRYARCRSSPQMYQESDADPASSTSEATTGCEDCQMREPTNPRHVAPMLGERRSSSRTADGNRRYVRSLAATRALT